MALIFLPSNEHSAFAVVALREEQCLHGGQATRCNVVYLGIGTTEITREDLPEDAIILPQVVTTAREPSLQKDPILYATETGCSLFVGLPWIHVASNMDITGHIACSGDTIRRSSL